MALDLRIQHLGKISGLVCSLGHLSVLISAECCYRSSTLHETVEFVVLDSIVVGREPCPLLASVLSARGLENCLGPRLLRRCAFVDLLCVLAPVFQWSIAKGHNLYGSEKLQTLYVAWTIGKLLRKIPVELMQRKWPEALPTFRKVGHVAI